MKAVTITQRLRYEVCVWRGLLVCLRRGHLIVGLGRDKNNAPYYCWTCFYNYPYTQWISLSQWVRNYLGGLIARSR